MIRYMINTQSCKIIIIFYVKVISQIIRSQRLLKFNIQDGVYLLRAKIFFSDVGCFYLNITHNKHTRI